MKISNLWWAATFVCVLVGLASGGNIVWGIASVFCLWRWDHADIYEHLKEIKERLDK